MPTGIVAGRILIYRHSNGKMICERQMGKCATENEMAWWPAAISHADICSALYCPRLSFRCEDGS